MTKVRLDSGFGRLGRRIDIGKGTKWYRRLNVLERTSHRPRTLPDPMVRSTSMFLGREQETKLQACSLAAALILPVRYY